MASLLIICIQDRGSPLRLTAKEGTMRPRGEERRGESLGILCELVRETKRKWSGIFLGLMSHSVN